MSFTFLVPARTYTSNLEFGDLGMIISVPFCIIEVNNCWGDLMDVRAQKKRCSGALIIRSILHWGLWGYYTSKSSTARAPGPEKEG